MLADYIREKDVLFAAGLAQRVEQTLNGRDGGLPPAMPPDEASLAFVGLLRGIHAELLHGGTASAGRLARAMWSIYRRAPGDGAPESPAATGTDQAGS